MFNDVELFFLAHSRVSTYKVARSPEAEKTTPSDPTSVLKQDFRQFDCKTWHLEPTVRLVRSKLFPCQVFNLM